MMHERKFRGTHRMNHRIARESPRRGDEVALVRIIVGVEDTDGTISTTYYRASTAIIYSLVTTSSSGSYW